ncbi:MAG: hypothetical protein EOP54_32000 [Sphingobacteriales bacterium]|nr:MAG: hypothetical protein EOP54_32000 [Sphingobacteriales bacterium]
MFTICCILNLLFVQQAKVYDTYTHTAGSIIIIIYAMLYFNKQSTAHVETGWGSNSLNWLNTGILLYFAGALAMFISMNYITTREMARWVYGTHNTVLLIEYILFAIGFSKCKA